LKERITQLDRGETISWEQVHARFEAFFKKLEQKAAREQQERAARGVFLREPVMVKMEISEPLSVRLNEAAALTGQMPDEFVEDAVLATLTPDEFRTFNLAAERNRESTVRPA
jgi:hypothetical protein